MCCIFKILPVFCTGARLYLATMRRFFLNVNTTIQEKSVTPVRKPISDRIVTYSL